MTVGAASGVGEGTGTAASGVGEGTGTTTTGVGEGTGVEEEGGKGMVMTLRQKLSERMLVSCAAVM